MKKLRIGFLSASGIGRKNWKAIYNSGNCVVSAVASRDAEKSRKYIDECQQEFGFENRPLAFGGYEELLASEGVDAVYIPLPTALRKSFVVRAAESHKHIICEKPCAINSSELEEMIAVCRKNQVQFMDGVMFMHNPRQAKVRETLNDGKSVGALRRISSSFSFFSGEEFFNGNIRVNGALEPAGCLGDLGWYSIRFALWTLNWRLPQTVSARMLAMSEPLPNRPAAPIDFSAELFYDEGVSVAFYCSFIAGRQQWVHVSGQNGWLLLPDFIHPFNSFEPAYEVNEKWVTVSSGAKCPPGMDASVQGHASAQDALMWRNYADQIATGRLNDDWPMWSVKTQKVMDACHEAARCGKAVRL
jgi:predicted dehydrogenase